MEGEEEKRKRTRVENCQASWRHQKIEKEREKRLDGVG